MTELQPPLRIDSTQRWFHGVTAGLLAVVFAASFLGVDRWEWLTPPGVPDECTSICLLRRATGLPCPTCGMTRSFCDIGRGEFGEALHQHPLGPLFYVLFGVLMVRSAIIALTGRPCLERMARIFIFAILPLVAVLVTVWVVRLWWLVASGEAAELWHASPLGQLISMMK